MNLPWSEQERRVRGSQASFISWAFQFQKAVQIVQWCVYVRIDSTVVTVHRRCAVISFCVGVRE